MVAMLSMWLLPAISRLSLLIPALVRQMAMFLSRLVWLTLATVPFPLHPLGQLVEASIMEIV